MKGTPRPRLRLGLALLLATLSLIRPLAADELARLREQMVDREIAAAGVTDKRVLAAMRETPRHEFVPPGMRKQAYFDMALAIGHGQTISPPYVVAYMTEQLDPQPGDKVLEIGTGSGYQAAVLSPLVRDVYTIEIVKPLGERAARTLSRLRYANVYAKVGDGYQGWPEHAPFDKIIVTCSPENVPPALVEQLREGGRMIVPVGERYQQTLYLFEKQDGKLNRIALLPTLFVPMTGKAEAGRVIKPDPEKPSIANGGFEELVVPGSTPPAHDPGGPPADEPPPRQPSGWHYQRQLEVMEGGEAPEGTRWVRLSNADPGREAQALQGMAIDGRKVRRLDVSLWAKAADLRVGADARQQPALSITFYDDNRSEAGFAWVGPWRDSFDWQQVRETLQVPARAREAVVRIALGGATGTLELDAIRIQAVP